MFSTHYNSRVKSLRNKKDLQRRRKIKPFINRYNWEGINFPSKQMIGKNFNKNNVTNTLIVLYVK